jgi:hypothetical protein
MASNCARRFSFQRVPTRHAACCWVPRWRLDTGRTHGVPDELVDLAGRQGFPLLSVEYRLAPQAGIEDIVSDAYAALRWDQTEGSLLVGLADPGPKAVVSYYGYGTLDSPWYSEPSLAHVAGLEAVTEQDAHKAVGRTVVADGHVRPTLGSSISIAAKLGNGPRWLRGCVPPTNVKS